MYSPRKISSDKCWLDEDKVKIYTIATHQHEVDQNNFIDRLKQVKQALSVDWQSTAAFAIFHEGESYLYLVLVWWGNDNELFTSISVKEQQTWITDPNKYSFCLYDMEVMWHERNIYIDTMDCAIPSLSAYQSKR